MKAVVLALVIGVLMPGQLLFAQSQIADSFSSPGVNGEGILTEGFVPCSGITCDLCDFMVMANTIIKWLFGMAFLFFAILAVRAGFKLVTEGNPGALQAAKQSFTNAFIGLIIFLCAWLLIDTLLHTLLKGGSGEIDGWGPWTKVRCVSQSIATTTPMYSGDNEFVGATTVLNSPGSSSITPVAAGSMVSLRSIGVNVADWNGTNGPGRTDLAHPTVANAVLSMQNSWKASHAGKTPFQVTAAYTEGVGHSANSQHYVGTAVDLQPVSGGANYDQIIQLCRSAGFTFINDERGANHIHCDMGGAR